MTQPEKWIHRAENHQTLKLNNNTKRVTIPKNWIDILDFNEKEEIIVKLVQNPNGNYGVLVLPK